MSILSTGSLYFVRRIEQVTFLSCEKIGMTYSSWFMRISILSQKTVFH